MKPIFYLATLSCLLLMGCNPGPSLQEQKSDYRDNLTEARDLLVINATVAADLCSKHSEAWRAGVFNGDGIQYAVANSKTENQEMIAELLKGKSVIESKLSRLNSPPVEFATAHAKIVTVYGTYSGIVDAATSPSGSLLTYNQTIERLQQDFLKGVNELKVLTP